MGLRVSGWPPLVSPDSVGKLHGNREALFWPHLVSPEVPLPLNALGPGGGQDVIISTSKTEATHDDPKVQAIKRHSIK